jgi:CRP-like cAMP-binding protein
MRTMHARRVVGVLEQVPLFSDASTGELRRLAACVSLVDVNRGRIISREGWPGREFVLVLDGAAAVSRHGALRYRLGPGGFFGEVSLLAGHRQVATIVAETDMSVGVLTRAEFLELVPGLPSVSAVVMEGLARLAVGRHPLCEAEVRRCGVTSVSLTPSAGSYEHQLGPGGRRHAGGGGGAP